ncbi:Hypothetical protein NGAL_HAMBI2605_59000 [Neorhizobium galegae bv. orientalis]|nr:Hypothetical protein NGAL_HAMBI2605_59000 [Neorhizobium galegae bv. orientalis]
MPLFGKGLVMDLSFPWPFGPASIAMLCAAAFFYTLSLFSSMPAPLVLLSAAIICSFCASISLVIIGSGQNITAFSLASILSFIILVFLVKISGVYSKLRSIPVEESNSTIIIRFVILFAPMLAVSFALFKYRYTDCYNVKCSIASNVFGDRNHNIVYNFWSIGLSLILIWGIWMRLLELIARIRNLTQIGN